MISGRRSFRLLCALLLPTLFCQLQAPAAAHTHPFHKGLARLSVITAGGRFAWLRMATDSLERGSTQPDFDRGFRVWENEKHKHDAGLVSQIFANAVERFGQHARKGDIDTAWSEGARILAKAFHYFADQSEPMFGRRAERFQGIMGASPRGVADRTIAQALADGGRGEFRSAVEHYVLQYRSRGFTPALIGAVSSTLEAIEAELAKRVGEHLEAPHPKDPAAARREIEVAYFQYVAKLVALQNISVELFDEEARKLIPGEEPSPSIPGMAWVGRWSYWVTGSDGKVFGRGTAWFQISREGNKLVLSTHTDRSSGPKAGLRRIDDNSLEIHFHDRFRNYMAVRRTSPNTITGQHWSPGNPNKLYAREAAKVEGHKK